MNRKLIKNKSPLDIIIKCLKLVLCSGEHKKIWTIKTGQLNCDFYVSTNPPTVRGSVSTRAKSVSPTAVV